nr:contractile injection system protein, VgrG/Pvc8 family [Sphingomonas sp. CARO-RG-8B-R24-01]
MTWRDPLTKGAVIATAGDPCEVYLGDDLVISGFIDEEMPGGDGNSRALTLTGRGKCQDLVDCSAEWPTNQLLNGDALSISKKLASAYGIEVILANGASAGPQVPQWALNYTETPAAIIQRLAQNAGLLAYEDSAGRLLLANVGAAQAASGVQYGPDGNVERWAWVYSMHERYSDVVCARLGTSSLGDLAGSDFFHTETDPNVPRHRQLDIVLAEVAEPAEEFTIRRAKWEVARRAGRSTVARVTIDSWRDSANRLWLPNTLVPVDLPDQHVSGPLLLSEVTFRRGGDGTHADLTLMPKDAFAIEPINLLPSNTADITSPSLP